MSWTVPAITLASLVVAGGVVATQTDINLFEEINPWSTPTVEEHMPVDTLVELCNESPVAALEQNIDPVEIRSDAFGVSQVVYGEFDGMIVPNHIEKMREAQRRAATAASPEQVAERLRRARVDVRKSSGAQVRSKSRFAPKNYDTREFFTQSRYAASRGIDQPKYYRRHVRGSYKRPQHVNVQPLNSNSRAVRSNRFGGRSIMEGTRFESVREATDRYSNRRGRQVNKTYKPTPDRNNNSTRTDD